MSSDITDRKMPLGAILALPVHQSLVCRAWVSGEQGGGGVELPLAFHSSVCNGSKQQKSFGDLLQHGSVCYTTNVFL